MTDQSTTLDLDALERAARAATPGEWTNDAEGCVGIRYKAGGAATIITMPVALRRNAAFIALANPATILSMISEIRSLRDALEPFADAGRIIDGPFGPALFVDDDDAFKTGCAWTENGERKTLTWGDFRRAALTKAGEPHEQE